MRKLLKAEECRYEPVVGIPTAAAARKKAKTLPEVVEIDDEPDDEPAPPARAAPPAGRAKGKAAGGSERSEAALVRQLEKVQKQLAAVSLCMLGSEVV